VQAAVRAAADCAAAVAGNVTACTRLPGCSYCCARAQCLSEASDCDGVVAPPWADACPPTAAPPPQAPVGPVRWAASLTLAVVLLPLAVLLLGVLVSAVVRVCRYYRDRKPAVHPGDAPPLPPPPPNYARWPWCKRRGRRGRLGSLQDHTRVPVTAPPPAYRPDETGASPPPYTFALVGADPVPAPT
jgi:hypothetical protein